MTICSNCNGEGIVGQGDKPWLQQGHKETCKACKGTGQVDDNAASAAPQTPPAGPVSTENDPATGDNAAAPKEDGSPDGGDNQASQTDQQFPG